MFPSEKKRKVCAAQVWKCSLYLTSEKWLCSLQETLVKWSWKELESWRTASFPDISSFVPDPQLCFPFENDHNLLGQGKEVFWTEQGYSVHPREAPNPPPIPGTSSHQILGWLGLLLSKPSTKLLFSPLQRERQCRRCRSDRSTGHHEAEQKKEQGLVSNVIIFMLGFFGVSQGLCSTISC